MIDCAMNVVLITVQEGSKRDETIVSALSLYDGLV